MEAPSVADAQSQLKLARTAVEHIHQALQTPTAKAGEAMCTNRNQSRRMVGHIEADAHGLRKLYVSQANPCFQKEVTEAAVRYKKANPGKQLQYPSTGKHTFEYLGLRPEHTRGLWQREVANFF